MSQVEVPTPQKVAKKKTALIRYFVYGLLWFVFLLMLVLFIRPDLAEPVPSYAVRTIGIALPILLVLGSFNFLGFIEFSKSVVGFLIFPLRVMFDSTFLMIRTYFRARRWYGKFSSKSIIYTLTAVYCVFGYYNQNPAYSDVFVVAGFLALIPVVLRITEKALDPMGSLGKMLEAALTISESSFIVRFFASKKNNVSDNNQSVNNLERLLVVLGITSKFPTLIQNPRIPLVLFMLNLIPVVGVTVFIFAIIYQAELVGDPAYSDFTFSEFLRLSVYQFFGSDLHALPSPSVKIGWILGVQSIVAYYYQAVLMLAVGLTAQAQVAKLGELANGYLTNRAKHFNINLAEIPLEKQILPKEVDPIDKNTTS